MKQYSLVYIEWCDAIDRGPEWIDEIDAKEWGKNDEWIICQLGFVIKETKKYILICGKVNYQDKDTKMLNLLTKIPKTWIIKRKKIKL